MVTSSPILDLPPMDDMEDFSVNQAIGNTADVNTYRELLIALAENREIPDTDLSKILGKRTHEQFEKDLARVKRRRRAAIQFAEAREFEKTTVEVAHQCSSIAYRRLQSFVVEAQQNHATLTLQALHAKSQWDQARGRLSNLRSQANNELQSTFGGDNQRSLIAALQNEIEQKQQWLKMIAPNKSDHEKLRAALASIHATNRLIESKQSELDGMEPGSPGRGKTQAELVMLQTQLGKAREVEAAFNKKKGEADDVNAEIVKLHADLERAAHGWTGKTLVYKPSRRLFLTMFNRWQLV